MTALASDPGWRFQVAGNQEQHLFMPTFTPAGDPVCPVCGYSEVNAWADDGEADLADWWECAAGDCHAGGAMTQVGALITQNGHPVPDDRPFAPIPDTPNEPERRFLVAVFDVTGLSDDEVGQLGGEVYCQAESSDYDDDGRGGHPDVPVGMLDTSDALGDEPLAGGIPLVQTSRLMANLYGPDDVMIVVPIRPSSPSERNA